METSRRAHVRWYDPVQLLRTGIDIFVAELLNAHADTRLLEIRTGPEPSFVEGENDAGDDGFWLTAWRTPVTGS